MLKKKINHIRYFLLLFIVVTSGYLFITSNNLAKVDKQENKIRNTKVPAKVKMGTEILSTKPASDKIENNQTVKPQEQDAPINQNKSQIKNSVILSTPQTTTKAIESKDQNLLPVSTQQRDQEKEQISVTFSIPSQNITQTISVDKDITVLNLMSRLQQYGKLNFKTKKYSYGELVEEINGTASNKLLNKYWTYYLNDKFANLGISQQKLNDQDKVEWRYGN